MTTEREALDREWERANAVGRRRQRPLLIAWAVGLAIAALTTAAYVWFNLKYPEVLGDHRAGQYLLAVPFIAGGAAGVALFKWLGGRLAPAYQRFLDEAQEDGGDPALRSDPGFQKRDRSEK